MKVPKTSEISSRRGSYSLLTAALVALGLVSSAQAQIQTAGTLFVNMDATTQPLGPVTSVTNSGTLGGIFEARSGPTFAPEIATHSTTKGVRFHGGDYMQLVDSPGGALILAPAGLTGVNPTRSIEVWAMNPDIFQEEAMVTWGKRGGPCGANMSFNYGNDPQWGAVANWCGRDLGWKNALYAPAVKQWHHLVYTYDGTNTTVYADGVLSNTEGVIDGDVNTHPDTPINLAAQMEPDGVTPNIFGSLTIGRVRIHDGVLTPLQVLSNYNFEKNDFVNPPLAPESLVAGPANRYSFNEAATTNAEFVTFVDSVGGMNGMVLGAHAQFTGTRLVLPGGPSATEAYGDLPNGLISSRSANNGGTGEVTVEGWVRLTANINWTRIFDFGSAREGEVGGPGGLGTAGYDYWFYSAQNGGDTATHRVELTNNDPGELGGRSADVTSTGTFGNDLHFAVTWKESTGEVRVYENGVEMNAFTAAMSMSDLNDINVWLGRSNFTFDNNTGAEYDEFRVYNRILSPGEILGNFQAGANTLNTGAQPVTLVDEPDSMTVYESYTARFAVATAGSPPHAYQWKRNGTAIPGATSSVYSLTAVLADNNAQFSCTVSNNTGTPHVVTSSNAVLTVVTQAVSLQNLYSFNETSGTTAEDSVGGANGELLGGASFNGTGQVVLDGVDGYVNLPNDLISNLTSITFETWVADDGSGIWGRIIDFGNSVAGEDFFPPSGQGTQYFMLAHPSGPGPLRAVWSLDSSGGEQPVLGTVLPLSQIKHVVYVLNAPMHTGRLFVDGVQAGENTGITLTPASLGSTVNNWLGRAQWGQDPFFHGRYDEFRIYNGAMTPAKVAASFAAGPTLPFSLKAEISVPNQITISWPAAATGYVLENSATVPTGLWTTVTNTPTLNGDRMQVTLPASPGNQFFRLRK